MKLHVHKTSRKKNYFMSLLVGNKPQSNLHYSKCTTITIILTITLSYFESISWSRAYQICKLFFHSV